mmetsp:Transcript_33853/g.54199  ORF Transcript_33853/g.54199 Transcript_33853/m.54199 type:complete len:848 (-) Transcript_33853:201-2744(-)
MSATGGAAKRGGLSQEEQEKYFNDACENVRKNAFYMQQQLDSENLHDALRYASTMINELRTSKLFPTRYYEVYMNVTNQLTHLEAYIDAEYKKKCQSDSNSANVWLQELYDRVQYCGNIVPRLYLLATVASVCLKVHQNEHEEVMRILFDLVSLTKGVQHPTRGLFLRNYLSQISRLMIPDVPDNVKAQSLDDHPIVKRAVDFVLQNFAEMTRLWVRMQHQGAVRDRTKRERERLQLRMLVGTNLRRLSELNVVTAPVYKDYVLKKVTEQIVKCKDRIAQEYLMECLIMVFSDDYHLKTLDGFLSVVNKLQSTVNVNSIIIKLMERLSKYAAEDANKTVFQEKDIFAIFQNYCKQIIEKHKKMTLDDILALYVELVNFAAECYPGRDEYIGTMLDETLAVIEKHEAVPSSCVSHIHRMMVAPIRAMNIRVLQLKSYCQLMSTLPSRQDKQTVSCEVVEVLTTVALREKVWITTPEEVDKLFSMIEPLLYDEESSTATKGADDEKKKSGDDEEDEEFDTEQNLVAKLIHLIRNDKSTDIHYKTLHLARKYFGKGGERRLLYTFPPMVFNCLRLIQTTHGRLSPSSAEEDDSSNDKEYEEVTVKPKKMFQFVHQVCTAYGSHNPEICVRLWLQGALAADLCGFQDICYEFLSQSFLCFEEHVSDSTEQYEAIRCITSALQQVSSLDEENFDTLRSKCVSHSNRLLKKPCAAQCFILCANLYQNTQFKDGRVACKCLIKACKRASQMMEGTQMIAIFIQVLNKYIYLMLNKCADFDYEKVTQLIALIRDKIKEQQSSVNLGADQDDSNAADHANQLQEMKQFFRLSCQYINDLKSSNDDDIAKAFANIDV